MFTARYRLGLKIRHSLVLRVLNVVRDTCVFENKLFIWVQNLEVSICASCVTRTSTFQFHPILDDWLTVHRSITLFDLQLDAQNSYLFIHNTFILKSSTRFEHYPAHLQEVYVVIVYMQPLVSSLSAGDCPVHRLRKNSSFLTGAQDLQRVTIPEAAYIQLRRRPPEDEQGNARNM